MGQYSYVSTHETEKLKRFKEDYNAAVEKKMEALQYIFKGGARVIVIKFSKDKCPPCESLNGAYDKMVKIYERDRSNNAMPSRERKQPKVKFEKVAKENLKDFIKIQDNISSLTQQWMNDIKQGITPSYTKRMVEMMKDLDDSTSKLSAHLKDVPEIDPDGIYFFNTGPKKKMYGEMFDPPIVTALQNLNVAVGNVVTYPTVQVILQNPREGVNGTDFMWEGTNLTLNHNPVESTTYIKDVIYKQLHARLTPEEYQEKIKQYESPDRRADLLKQSFPAIESPIYNRSPISKRPSRDRTSRIHHLLAGDEW